MFGYCVDKLVVNSTSDKGHLMSWTRMEKIFKEWKLDGGNSDEQKANIISVFYWLKNLML